MARGTGRNDGASPPTHAHCPRAHTPPLGPSHPTHSVLPIENQPKSTADSFVSRKPSGALVIDDGERPLEKAYIDACVVTGNVEALFYAIQRKRARLVRGAFDAALTAHDARWGDLMRDLEERAGGLFTGEAHRDRLAGGAAAQAFADDAAEGVDDGAAGTEYEIDVRNLEERK